MKSIICFCLLGVSVMAVQAADTMTLSNGQVVKGRFNGFANRKFEFKAENGTVISEYPVNVKTIIPEAPLKVSVMLALSNYENVEFSSFDDFTLHLAKDGNNVDERVIMLKQLTVNRPPEDVPPPAPDKPAPVVGSKNGGTAPSGEAREWKRAGKWREIESKDSAIISNGEEVEIEDHLKMGSINIVHFHYPKALVSIREGNYIEALAAKSSNRIVILKILAPDFKAPICEALGIKSLPQFWFYDTRGRLVKKLTDRFTEGDIDGALKQARLGAN